MNYTFLLVLLINFLSLSNNYSLEIENETGLEIREFHKQEAYPFQKNTYSNYYKSKIFFDLTSNFNIILEPYYRYDMYDRYRTNFDLNEAYFFYLKNNYEIKLGSSEVFWGITESKNLVDIINTKDITDGDPKEKLGQPMINYSIFFDESGIFDFFYLPLHVKTSQIGKEGRLRFAKPINNYNIVYEGGAGKNIPSWALKWEKNFSDTDLSLQFFRGTSRETSAIPSIEDLKIKYFPGYERITQFGAYIQKIYGPVIYKIEAINRRGQKNTKNIRENYTSYTLGFEHIINRIFNKIWDITFFMEYSNDDRGNDSNDVLQNDIFIAGKLNFNNIHGTEFLSSTTFDLDGGGNTASVEISTRITDNIRFTGTYQSYWSMNNKDILYSFRRDNYFGIKVVNYF